MEAIPFTGGHFFYWKHSFWWKSLFSTEAIPFSHSFLRKSFLLVEAISFLWRQYFAVKNIPLQKIPQFHLISWGGSFVERNSFRIVSANRSTFHTRKLRKIAVFFAVFLLVEIIPLFHKFSVKLMI